MYGAVEAGSIPITVFDKAYYTHPCKGLLDDQVDGPKIVLKLWHDLLDTLTFYKNDPEALVQKQDDMRVWYAEYMHKTVQNFENLVLANFLQNQEIDVRLDVN